MTCTHGEDRALLHFREFFDQFLVEGRFFRFHISLSESGCNYRMLNSSSLSINDLQFLTCSRIIIFIDEPNIPTQKEEMR